MLHVGGSGGGLSMMRAQSYPTGVMASAPLQVALPRMDFVLTATTTMTIYTNMFAFPRVVIPLKAKRKKTIFSRQTKRRRKKDEYYSFRVSFRL